MMQADVVNVKKIGPDMRAVLVQAALATRQQGGTLWLVGGVVRDLLLGIPPERDLDLVVEGDAVALAHTLASTMGGEVIAAHPEFGTASVRLPSSLAHRKTDEKGERGEDNDHEDHWGEQARVVDLAMARTETYPYPAALPIVQPALLHQDLIRRDFSINAMAVEIQLSRLSQPPKLSGGGASAYGEAITGEAITFSPLLDPFGGQRDLRAGVLRVLHEHSFDDDPTRIVRGLRVAARLSFRFEPHTLCLLKAALATGRIAATSPERIRSELCLALEEPAPEEVLRLADEWGITLHIVPSLRWNETLAKRCQDARTCPRLAARRSLLLLGAITWELTPDEREACIARYRLPGEVSTLLREVGAARTILPTLRTPGLKNSEIDSLLSPLSEITLEVMRCSAHPPLSTLIARYQHELRPVRPLLNGHDLQRLGVVRGPQLGRLLRELRAAQLDGEILSQAEADGWVRCQLADV